MMKQQERSLHISSQSCVPLIAMALDEQTLNTEAFTEVSPCSVLLLLVVVLVAVPATVIPVVDIGVLIVDCSFVPIVVVVVVVAGVDDDE
jgi:hypothetical protein